jgi:hypothetical protein
MSHRIKGLIRRGNVILDVPSRQPYDHIQEGDKL